MRTKSRSVPIGFIANALQVNKRYSNEEFAFITGIKFLSAEARASMLRKDGFLTIDSTEMENRYYMTQQQKELMIARSIENKRKHGKHTVKRNLIENKKRSAIDILLFSTAIV